MRRKKKEIKTQTFGLPGRSAERSCFLGLVDGFGVTIRKKSASSEKHIVQHNEDASNLSNSHLHHRFLNTRNPRTKQRKPLKPKNKHALRRDRWMARQRAEQYAMAKKKKKSKNLRKPRSGGRSSSDQSYDSQQDRNRRQRHVTKDGRRPSIERQLIAQ